MMMMMLLLLLLLVLVFHHIASPGRRSFRPIPVAGARVVHDELQFFVILICDKWFRGVASGGTTTEQDASSRQDTGPMPKGDILPLQ
jgi:hypothetical protein